jgi:hypothetical protein
MEQPVPLSPVPHPAAHPQTTGGPTFPTPALPSRRGALEEC